MRTGAVVPLSSDEPIESKPQTPTGIRLTFFNAPLPTFTLMPSDTKTHWLEWLTPQELAAIAQTCTEQYELSKHPSLWIKFLKPEFQKGPDSPEHGASLETFRTQAQARLANFIFLGLHDKEGCAWLIQKKKISELMQLLRQKYPDKLRAIVKNLNQPHIQSLLETKRLDLNTVMGLDDNAVIILGYSWIINLCRTGKTALALALTQYTRSLIHSTHTSDNLTHPIVQDLVQQERLNLDQAVFLTAAGRDNLNDAKTRQAYLNGELSYEQLCEENPLAKNADSEADQKQIATGCCRIS